MFIYLKSFYLFEICTNTHTICVCTPFPAHLLLYQMWGCDHNIGRCEFLEFTIKPAAPKAKLIYFILSAERPRSASVALHYRCLIWDSGRCIVGRLSYIDSKDLEVCDIIMRIDLLVLWPGESRRGWSHKPLLSGGHGHCGIMGKLVARYLLGWPPGAPTTPQLSDSVQGSPDYIKVCICNLFLAKIGLKYKNRSPVVAAMNYQDIKVSGTHDLIIKMYVLTIIYFSNGLGFTWEKKGLQTFHFFFFYKLHFQKNRFNIQLELFFLHIAFLFNH